MSQSFGTKDYVSTYNRLRKKIWIFFVVCLLFLVTILAIKKKAPPIGRERMNAIIDYINKEMDRILQFKTREEQNEEFANLTPDLPIQPVRMTLSTAVFKYETKSSSFIIKRVIFNGKNGLEEDKMSLRLKGENIVRTLDAYRTKWTTSSGEVQKIIWIFLERLDVKVSQKYVKGSEETIRTIVKDALKGLSQMHAMGIAHLDIKIENIMGKRNGDDIIYQLIDFGYARKMPKEGQIMIPNKNYGTYPYRPPEVIRRYVHAIKSDIWSIGAVAWFLSLTRVPFMVRSKSGVKKDYKAYHNFLLQTNPKKKFFFAPGTSRELRSFIETCMRNDMDERPSASELLYHPFIFNTRNTEKSSVETTTSFVSSSYSGQS